jgi:hypothetical protein
MPTTLNPTCPLCGLRYNDRPLLELHLREDHRQRDHRAEPAPDDSGAAATAAATADPTGAATGAATTAAAARPPRHPRPGWARTALHRTVWALRFADQEMMRVYEALARPRRVSSHGGDSVASGGRA